MPHYGAVAWIVPAAVAALLASTMPGSATPLGSNILTNGNAEAGVGSASGNDIEAIPGWTTTSNFTVVQYGAPAFPDPTISTAIGGGINFFAGGPSTALSTAAQTINIGDLASTIDAGSLSANLSAYLGGFDGQDDNITLTATFLNGASSVLGAVTIGPVTETDRAGVTTLLPRSGSAAIPVNTRSISIELVATRLQGSYDDGYADNLSLVLSGSAPVPVPEAASIWLLAAGLTGIAIASGHRRRKSSSASASMKCPC
jgi:hypothetical protein